MSQIKTLDKENIIPDITHNIAASDKATGDVSSAAISTPITRSPLARAADDKGITGNQRFASELPSVRHTDDGDINSCSHTNMTNTNPSDVASLSCGSSNDARGPLTIALREIVQKRHMRCRSLTKGCRKGIKKPLRVYYKFYKPMHLWSLPIYAETRSAIRHVSYRQASTITNRKSDNGLYAYLTIRDELNVLDEDPTTAVRSWRTRYSVFCPILEYTERLSACRKHLNSNIQSLYLNLSSPLICAAQ